MQVAGLKAGDVVEVALPVSNVSGPVTVEGTWDAGGGNVYVAVRAVNGVLYSVTLPAVGPVEVLGTGEVAAWGVKPDLALAA